MRFTTKLLTLALFGVLIAGCDSPSETTEEVFTPDPVEPKIPSMDDCDTEDIFASQASMRLMTRYEYDNTIRDLLGVEETFAKDRFPPENAVSGFENNSDSHKVNPLLVREYLDAAEDISSRAINTQRPLLLPCESEDMACGRAMIDKLLPRAFRRPPTEAESDIFYTLFEDTLAESDFNDAAKRVIEAVIQSPQFLYKMELAEGMAPGGLVKVSSYQMANRLSYMIWASMPDSKLFEKAAADELATKEQVEAEVRRMMEDPKAQEGYWHFYRQWLHLDALETMTKDAELFPEYNDQMIQDWRQSLYDYVKFIHTRQPNVEMMMSSNAVFMNSNLAEMYGETPRGDSAQYSMSKEERAGLLTQPAVMALLSNANQGSPILRGIFVRERLLCQKLPPPPDDIAIEPPDPDPNATTREVFKAHTEVEGCAGCHRLIDPIGLGFENYDGVGRFRTVENGQDVDASGELLNLVDKSLEGPFDGGVEVATRLSNATEVRDCIADHWITYALGHPEKDADLCSAMQIRDKFAESGSFEDLMVAIATADTFRYRTVQVLEEDAQ